MLRRLCLSLCWAYRDFILVLKVLGASYRRLVGVTLAGTLLVAGTMQSCSPFETRNLLRGIVLQGNITLV